MKYKRAQEIPVSGRISYRNRLVGPMLSRHGRMIGEVIGLSDYSRTLVVGLGMRSFINGSLYQRDDVPVASVEYIEVDDRYRGHGIGERLLRGYVAKAKAEGARELWSDSVASAAISVRCKVFGEQLLQFYDMSSREAGRFLPMTAAQARQSNTLIDEHNARTENPSDRYNHIGVFVDLTKADTTDWELPLPDPRVLDIDIYGTTDDSEWIELAERY